jgi:hypothetical protein
MKVSVAIAALVGAGLIATDKKPEDVKAALVGALALDKKAKDEAKEKDEADCKAAAKDAGCEPKDMVKGKDGKWTKDTAGNDLPGKTPAKDKKAADEDDPDMGGNDEGVNAPLETPKPSPGLDAKAMDAAIATAVQSALTAERIKSAALFAARKDVEKVLGIVAYDSAEAVYGAALTHLKVEHKDVHPSALRALFHASIKTAPASTPIVGDAASVQTMEHAFPGFDRLRR